MSSTVTSVSLGRGHSRTAQNGAAGAQLILLLECDRPWAGSVRHALGDLDTVRFSRGSERGAERQDRGRERCLHITVPDRRMSKDHATLRLARGRWAIVDDDSKNGTIVNGTVVRRAVLADGDVVELGHAFFLYRDAVPVVRPEVAILDGQALDATPGLATFVADLAEGLDGLHAVAAAMVSVVLLGESGTGKEIMARALHELSGRPGAFMAINCGALPSSILEAELFGYRKGAYSGAVKDNPGLVRSADKGTLFLDEIGELAPSSQVAFLRVLQEQEVLPLGESKPVKVDTRLCTATHRDLEQLVEGGAFRRDLYARMSGYTLRLPPLRERREDLGMLIAALLRREANAESVSFGPEAMRAMLSYGWPLNIRELEKCLTTARALSRGSQIELRHLPEPTRAHRAEQEQATLSPEEQASRDRLVEMLTEHRGNVAAVARAMGKGRMQIHRWAKRFGLAIESFRR